MSSYSVTLGQLLSFKPQNNREKEIYNINQSVIDDINIHLQKDMYYLGGHIKMNCNDEINLELFDKVREINRQRMSEYGEPCNSFEAFSIIRHNTIFEETNNIVKKYFEVINLRENS